MPTATHREYGQRLGVTQQTITGLKREGRLVIASDGRIDVEASDLALADSIDWPLETSRGLGKVAQSLIRLGVVSAPQEASPAEVGHGPLTTIRARREMADAKLAELKLLREMGVLVATVDVEREWEPVLGTLRESLLSIPDRTSAVLAAWVRGLVARILETPAASIELELAQLEHQIHEIQGSEIRSALNELADRAGTNRLGFEAEERGPSVLEAS